MSRERISMQQMIYNFGLMFNQQPTSERIEIYTDVLLPLGEDVVKLAFERIIRSGSAFFPSVAEIYEAINPKKPDVSAMVANEIIKLLRIYGPHAESDLIKNASPLARNVLKHLGSTESIRASENTDMIRAQLERLAKSISQKVEYESSLHENIIDFKSQGLRKLSF